mmetsp:Transcript_14025/g.32678  ORF Transcript_14025/g.32678 Transcript_14025/m.32678 type:complete len:325 (+) Transcript_14025:469-1443(+)|eukprot:CAMPEP_0182600164 /NCGR_PEP_ID=MMETSP1324-20130603/90849_1 /TAXON_ID=236786 /ORGANISM="Florenciella sp., Strain RCC1587" /LENGTH=324 /DNA_ID=CAMNT_0024818075 /DNA_START=569 /DNA_END=1543 /DNA_ORIENTATION=+
MVHAISLAASRSRGGGINQHSRACGGGGRRGNRIYPGSGQVPQFAANPSYRDPYDFGRPAEVTRRPSASIHVVTSAKSLKRTNQRLKRKDSGSSVARSTSNAPSTSPNPARTRRSSTVISAMRSLATVLTKALAAEAGAGSGGAGGGSNPSSNPSPNPTGPRHPPIQPPPVSEPSSPIDRTQFTRSASWEERQAQVEEIRAQARRMPAVNLSAAVWGGEMRAQGASSEASSVTSPGGEVPSGFICSITCELMVDPVICMDGHTYERTAIERWLQSQIGRNGGFTSPKTNALLPNRTLLPNFALREAIEGWRAGNYSGAGGSGVK